MTFYSVAALGAPNIAGEFGRQHAAKTHDARLDQRHGVARGFGTCSGRSTPKQWCELPPAGSASIKATFAHLRQIDREVGRDHRLADAAPTSADRKNTACSGGKVFEHRRRSGFNHRYESCIGTSNFASAIERAEFCFKGLDVVCFSRHNFGMTTSKIYQDNLETIGNTPLVKIQRITAGLGGHVFGKVEARNPAFSVKGRIGAAMVWDAEKKGT